MLCLQLRELCEENALGKGRIAALEETVNVHEMEAKASRETIMRLVSEVNREQKNAASRAEEKDKLNQVQCVRCACASAVAFMKQKLKPDAGEHTCFTAHGLRGCSPRGAGAAGAWGLNRPSDPWLANQRKRKCDSVLESTEFAENMSYFKLYGFLKFKNLVF